MPPNLPRRFQNEHTILIAILLLALVNGLFYVALMPPWQHYDESNHFEYIWLLASRGEGPEPGDYDRGMRQAVAKSMIEHGFFEGLAEPPDLTAEKPWIGQFSQLNEPRLYYLLASIPLRLFPKADVTNQLYAARLVSLALFLVTILAGYGLVSEITSAGHPLRSLVPLTMALLPAFADLMTAVNNDVGGIAAFSIFLWGAVHLVRRGPSWLTLLWVLVACALCLFTKRTVYLALPLLGIALLFAFLRGKARVLAWGLVILAAVVGVMAVFSWGDAALWYRGTPQTNPTRSALSESPDGKSAFTLTVQPEAKSIKLVQIIPPETAGGLSGVPLTLGAWMWASQPIDIQSPQMRFHDGAQTFGDPAGEAVTLTEKPQFMALNFTPQGNTRRAWVILEPRRHLDIPDPVTVYYDGLVLTAGSYPVDQAPQFDGGGSSGVWGGEPFENLLRNPSAESGWPYLRPWADKIASRFFSDFKGQDSFSLTVYSLFDLPASQGYYRAVLTQLLRTFWAKFGWANVPLEGARPYALILLPVTILAAVGVGLNIWQHRRNLAKFPWDVLILLGLTLLLFWGATLVRGSTYLLIRLYVPVARYAYPAIIPTALFLSAGWVTLLATLERWLHLPGWVKYAVYAGFFILLNIYSLVSIVRFYGG